MIGLTLRNTGRRFYIAPEHIHTTGDYLRPDGERFYVTYEGDGGDGTEIVESPTDVARLRAAWERRHNARELRPELPIAVYMGKGSEGQPAIMFMCCQHTHDLRVGREAKRRKLFSGLLPAAFRSKSGARANEAGQQAPHGRAGEGSLSDAAA